MFVDEHVRRLSKLSEILKGFVVSDQYWKQPDSIDLKLNSLPLSDKLMAVFYDR